MTFTVKKKKDLPHKGQVNNTFLKKIILTSSSPITKPNVLTVKRGKKHILQTICK